MVKNIKVKLVRAPIPATATKTTGRPKKGQIPKQLLPFIFKKRTVAKK